MNRNIKDNLLIEVGWNILKMTGDITGYGMIVSARENKNRGKLV